MAESENNEALTSFLGTGWSFPPEFVIESGEVRMTTDEADIEASLKILLGTTTGERFLNPKYGLDLQEMLFEAMSTTTATFLKDQIKTTILIYEPRINLVSVELDAPGLNDGRVTIILEYEIRATNSRYNLVYPYYLGDSSEVRPSTPGRN